MQITEIKREGMIARLPAGSVQRFKMAKIDPVSPLYLPWVPEDIFFLIDTDGSRRSQIGSLIKP